MKAKVSQVRDEAFRCNDCNQVFCCELGKWEDVLRRLVTSCLLFCFDQRDKPRSALSQFEIQLRETLILLV